MARDAAWYSGKIRFCLHLRGKAYLPNHSYNTKEVQIFYDRGKRTTEGKREGTLVPGSGWDHQGGSVSCPGLIVCRSVFFAGDFVRKTFVLAVSGNVTELAEYFRSFGPWAILISFLIDILINAGGVFPSIFVSTANGLIFGLPVGIAVSWLAETTGVVISFLLMRFFFRNSAQKLIHKANRLQDIDRASEKMGYFG